MSLCDTPGTKEQKYLSTVLLQGDCHSDLRNQLLTVHKKKKIYSIPLRLNVECKLIGKNLYFIISTFQFIKEDTWFTLLGVLSVVIIICNYVETN